jgi:hypothetical protein
LESSRIGGLTGGRSGRANIEEKLWRPGDAHFFCSPFPTNTGRSAAMTCAERPSAPASVTNAAHCSDSVRPKAARPSTVSKANSSAKKSGTIVQRIALLCDTRQWTRAQRQMTYAAVSMIGTSARVPTTCPKRGATKTTRIVPKRNPNAKSSRKYAVTAVNAGFSSDGHAVNMVKHIHARRCARRKIDSKF